MTRLALAVAVVSSSLAFAACGGGESSAPVDAGNSTPVSKNYGNFLGSCTNTVMHMCDESYCDPSKGQGQTVCDVVGADPGKYCKGSGETWSTTNKCSTSNIACICTIPSFGNATVVDIYYQPQSTTDLTDLESACTQLKGTFSK